MFEILSALRDANTACMAHGTSLRWEVIEEPGVGPMLKAEIALTEADVEFVNGMRALLAPVEE